VLEFIVYRCELTRGICVCVGTVARVMLLEVKALFSKFHEKFIECQISAQILLTATVHNANRKRCYQVPSVA
jgi:hypothetical protein